MKRIILAFTLALALLLTGCTPAADAVSAAQDKSDTLNESSSEASSSSEELVTSAEPSAEGIIVLYTNDVHCAVTDPLGYQGLAAVKNALLQQNPNVLLVDAGDAVQGSTIGTLSQGESILKIMNQLGYDVATPGNHEFDYGMDQFFKLMEEANFPYVSANFMDADGASVLEPYVLKEIGRVKIAFVGISTPCTLTSSTPAYFQDEQGEYIYSFCQDKTGELLYSTVQSAVDAARGEGADYVIALAHLGIDSSTSPWTSSDVINNTTGIDVVLDGHSHTVLESEVVKNKDGYDVLLSSTGTQLQNIGCLTISAAGVLTTKLINDGGVRGTIDTLESEYEETLNTVVASSEVTLAVYDPNVTDKDGNPIRLVRRQETNLGDLCADAYRAATGADVAFVNGGGVRADIPAGDITYGQIISVHPFGNELCMVEVTGQQILDALEFGASALPGESGGFLQVSGMTYEIDLNVASTATVDENGMFTGVTGEYRVKNVTVGGEPLNLTKTYTLASHDYMIKNSGDGYSMFADCHLLLDSIVSDYQALINYITVDLGGTVGSDYSDPYGSGRITILESR